ncbi:MAG: hypothetical protein LLF80_03955 [Porphyromonadaceae bacterium]|nr:hypothetical protein [Porphyromonadaceae bacterium]
MTATLELALLIAVLGIGGIFIFMALFYLMIRALDKYLPYREDEPEGKSSE